MSTFIAYQVFGDGSKSVIDTITTKRALTHAALVDVGGRWDVLTWTTNYRRADLARRGYMNRTTVVDVTVASVLDVAKDEHAFDDEVHTRAMPDCWKCRVIKKASKR